MTVSYKIELAEKVFEIHNIYDKTFNQCECFITDKPADFKISITEDDISFEREKSVHEALFEGLVPYDFSDEEYESTATYRKIAELLIGCNITVFHGAAIAVGDEAYLFTAKSGTGKTTHINLWLDNIPGAYVINGDKPLLMIKDDMIYVCGSPWAGKENIYSNKIVPLKALCILERGEENYIEEIESKEAFPMLMQQIYRCPNQMPIVMRITGEIARKTKLYKLHCNMDSEAAYVSYRGMNNDI